MPSCSHCGAENSVDQESIDGHDHLVCYECGGVQDDAQFVLEEGGGLLSTWNAEQQSTKSKLFASVSSSERTLGKWRSKCKQLCGSLKLPSGVTEKACALLTQMRSEGMVMQQRYLAACVLCAVRERGCTVPIKDIAHAAQVPEKHLHRTFRRLKDRLEGFCLPSLDVPKMCSDLVEQLSSDFSLKDGQVQHARRLVEICDKQLLGSGQRPDIRCLACLVVVLESAHWKPSRVQQVLLEKSRVNKYAIMRIMKLSVSIKRVLIKLAEALPWSQGAMTEREMFDKLPDVLKYSTSLTDKATGKNTSDALIFKYHAPFERPVKKKQRARLERSMDRLFEHLLMFHQHSQPPSFCPSTVGVSQLLSGMPAERQPVAKTTPCDSTTTEDRHSSCFAAESEKDQAGCAALSEGAELGNHSSERNTTVSYDDCSSDCSLDDEERWILGQLRNGVTKDAILDGEMITSADSGDLDPYGDRCELDNDDIPDDKLDDYIRSPTEVEGFQRLLSREGEETAST